MTTASPRIGTAVALAAWVFASGAFARGEQADIPDSLAKARTAIEARVRASGAEVALAFRSLETQGELLINPDEPFHAASTMKVPVMIELFAQARAGKVGLDDPLPVRNEFASLVDGSPYGLDPGEDSDPEIYKAVGGTLSLRRLCEAMITSSSNLATNLLIEKVGIENVRRTVESLGARGMQVRRGVEDGKAFRAGIVNTTTARGLLVLLEKLARGVVVDPESSRAMVEVLKRQKFGDAIPAGLPAGVPVAHKTGQITKIRHDAAIVYARHPFVLVILVRGLADEKASASLMADITRTLYPASQGEP